MFVFIILTVSINCRLTKFSIKLLYCVFYILNFLFYCHQSAIEIRVHTGMSHKTELEEYKYG